jgi:hypothetical protein
VTWYNEDVEGGLGAVAVWVGELPGREQAVIVLGGDGSSRAGSREFLSGGTSHASYRMLTSSVGVPA